MPYQWIVATAVMTGLLVSVGDDRTAQGADDRRKKTGQRKKTGRKKTGQENGTAGQENGTGCAGKAGEVQ